MGGLLFLIVVLIVFGLAYYIGIMAYSYTMESLHKALNYTGSQEQLQMLNTLVYGFIWIFLATTIVIYLVESYKRAKIERMRERI